MGTPDNTVKKFRWLIALVLFGGLIACSKSNDDCDAGIDSDTCDVISEDGSPSGNNENTDSRPLTPAPLCFTEQSDLDGDGYGFENGASCRVSGAFVTVADINHVIVVTGQSNVEAPLTAFDPVLDVPHPRVFAFTDSGWQIADLHQVWDEHAHPGNHSLTDPTQSPNNNFVFHFGKTLANLRADAVPAFIVLAAPGEGISHWDQGSPFYLKMQAKISNALAQIPNKDTVDVLLWHQGENDWLYEGTSDLDATGFTDRDSEEYRNYYPIKLRNLIANFRGESWATNDMPFICGELRIAEGVSRHLMALNNDGDPNTGCVPSADLPYRLSDPTGNHFSAAGLRELGRRYMQKYLAIIGG